MINLRYLSKKAFSSRLSHLSTRSYSTQGLVARYEKHGNPTKVIKIEKESIGPVESGQVLVKMIKAPVNPSDLSVIDGTHSIFPEASRVGSEGVGEVIEVGKNVTGLKKGDYVIPASTNIGTWRSLIVNDQSAFIPIKEKSVPLEYLSTLSMNPITAYLLLENFVQLNKGDVIIQNGANSTVGKCIVQLAKLKGVKTVNLIRESENFDQNASLIKSYGGHIVDTYNNLSSHTFQKKLNDLPPPKLLINCVGGKSVTEAARLLQNGGTIVTYGSMSREPLILPTSLFVTKDIRMRGFSLEDWNNSTPAEEKIELYNKILGLIKDKSLKYDIENFNFEKDLVKAIERSTTSNSVKCVLNF